MSLGRLGGTNELRLAITLPLRDGAGLTNFLRDLYTPGNPNFHHYLKPGEFARRFGPSTNDYAAVCHFAAANGLTVVGVHSGRLAVDVTGKVSDVERAFHVHLKTYRHPTEKRNFFAPDAEPTVQAKLPILQVGGLDDFATSESYCRVGPVHAGGKADPRGGSGPGGAFAETDFRKAYVPGTLLDGTGQNIALVQFDGFYAVDITNYLAYSGDTNVPNMVVVPVDGGISSPGGHTDEVSLDIDMCIAMAPGISNIFVYEASPSPQTWMDLLTQIADDDLANQVSCSWGIPDPNLNLEPVFQQMAAQGQSFFAASGDSDAYHNPPGHIVPFPDESPNITIVGGTALTTDGAGNYGSETVWNDGTNNPGEGDCGGISPRVPIPTWQAGMNLNPAGGSSTLRNIPDVAMASSNVFIYYGNGSMGATRGTSCAAPLWAGFTALVNEQENQLGAPPVGFLNPAIYALARGTNYAAMFHDVVTGNNTNWYQPTNYFAVPGYDLCTGWGTPAGTNLINLLTTPEELGVSPQCFTFIGPFGGPFFPTNQTIALTNSGPMSLNWAMATNETWLSVSASSGVLPAGGSTNITLQYGALPPGNFTGVIYVTNAVLDSVQVVEVNVQVDPSIVVNGGFETGDFTGWTLNGDTVVGNVTYNTVAPDDFYPGIVHSGLFGAFLGEANTTASLTQTLPTVPGQQYQISFWLDETNDTGGVQQFAVQWDGTNIMNLMNSASFDWTNFQYTVTASSTNTVLEIDEENDPGYFGFDDVSVTPVPTLALGGIVCTNECVQLNWAAVPRATYTVLYTTNLATGGWQVLGNITAPTNIYSMMDSNILNGDPQRFYRLVLP